MEWACLLSTNKLSEEAAEPRDWANYPINAFEKDYNKIVSSAAFRRLQDKTQVFPLDKSDFIRTRLTHSIEVSTVARQLGIMISKNTTRYRQQAVTDFAEDISSVLLCAGLLHDLGNPPFGHFGEAVIGEWFQNNLGNIFYRSTENTPADQRHTLRDMLTDPQMIADLEHFEGNAQALRLLCKARHSSDINVSVSVISTLIKYPTNSLSFSRTDGNVAKHKLGHYLAEQETFLQIADMIGTKKEDGNVCRHPLAFFLEAADDIAYATADLEDAFKKGLFTLQEFIEYFKSRYDHNRVNIRPSQNNYSKEHYSNELIETLERYTDIPEDERFHRWIHYTRRWLMHNATFRFSKEYENIINGRFQKELFSDVNHTITMEILKGAMKEFVYDSPGILRLELSAQTILSFLLDKFVHAVLYFGCEDSDYKLTQADRKCLQLISNNYKNDYQEEIRGHEDKENYCLYLRLLMVTDYISGMTDSFARTLYRELSGIE